MVPDDWFESDTVALMQEMKAQYDALQQEQLAEQRRKAELQIAEERRKLEFQRAYTGKLEYEFRSWVEVYGGYLPTYESRLQNQLQIFNQQ
jgi:hypothetical protein